MDTARVAAGWSENTRILLLSGPSRLHLSLHVSLQSELGPVDACSGTVQEALDRLGAHPYGAVLVDVLPDDRISACARVRQKTNIPLLVIGDADGNDAAACLDAGADDYLTHPERTHEVAARVRARLRRTPLPTGNTRTLEAGGVRMDLDRHEVDVGGRVVHLPLKQFRLLELLMTNAGQVLTSRTIIENVWGPLETVDRNTVQAHVARLRQTLGDAEIAQRIRAVPGIGYTFPR